MRLGRCPESLPLLLHFLALANDLRAEGFVRGPVQSLVLNTAVENGPTTTAPEHALLFLRVSSPLILCRRSLSKSNDSGAFRVGDASMRACLQAVQEGNNDRMP